MGIVKGYIVSLPAGAMIAAPRSAWSLGDCGVRATLGG